MAPLTRNRAVGTVPGPINAEYYAQRTAIRISPGHPFNDMSENDPRETYDALLAELSALDLMYVHVLDTSAHVDYPVLEQVRSGWKGTIVANEGFTEEWDVDGADRLVADGTIDLVAYGRRFLANPDLPTRLRTGAELNAPDQDTFYTGGEKGYVDYPALAPQDAAA